jgi:Holliday junction resolvase RusA-like endonuclease
MAFRMVVARKPLSLQASNKNPYQEYLGKQARAFQGRHPLLDGTLYARITWFHSYRLKRSQDPDIDNIAKPILDSLGNIVFADDRQSVKCLTERISNEPGADLTISTQHQPESNVLGLLLSLIYKPERDILYVEIGEIESGSTVMFGPIDRGEL